MSDNGVPVPSSIQGATRHDSLRLVSGRKLQWLGAAMCAVALVLLVLFRLDKGSSIAFVIGSLILVRGLAFLVSGQVWKGGIQMNAGQPLDLTVAQSSRELVHFLEQRTLPTSAPRNLLDRLLRQSLPRFGDAPTSIQWLVLNLLEVLVYVGAFVLAGLLLCLVLPARGRALAGEDVVWGLCILVGAFWSTFLAMMERPPARSMTDFSLRFGGSLVVAPIVVGLFRLLGPRSEASSDGYPLAWLAVEIALVAGLAVTAFRLVVGSLPTRVSRREVVSLHRKFVGDGSPQQVFEAVKLAMRQRSHTGNARIYLAKDPAQRGATANSLERGNFALELLAETEPRKLDLPSSDRFSNLVLDAALAVYAGALIWLVGTIVIDPRGADGYRMGFLPPILLWLTATTLFRLHMIAVSRLRFASEMMFLRAQGSHQVAGGQELLVEIPAEVLVAQVVTETNLGCWSTSPTRPRYLAEMFEQPEAAQAVLATVHNDLSARQRKKLLPSDATDEGDVLNASS